MKRRFSITAGLAVLSAVFALSGCGGNSGGADNDTSGQDEEGSKEILFWNTGTGETDKLIYETAVKKFNESTKSGYHITSVASEPDVYKEKIVIAMSSGECPDLYANWSGGPMNEYIEAGYGQPIDELFDKSQIKDKMQEAAIAQGQYKGKM
ncbi:MAG: ABC transporter substrate-binding protein, partial [Blautia coccoides]